MPDHAHSRPTLLRAASSLSFGTAAIVFLFGGLFLSIVAGISRLIGELIGILLTFLIGWVGMELKKMADRIEKTRGDHVEARQ